MEKTAPLIRSEGYLNAFERAEKVAYKILGTKLYQAYLLYSDPYYSKQNKKKFEIEQQMYATGGIHFIQALVKSGLILSGVFFMPASIVIPFTTVPLVTALTLGILVNTLFGDIYPLMLQRYVYLSRKGRGRLAGKFSF